MRLKERRGECFVFDGAYAGDDLVMIDEHGGVYSYKQVAIDTNFNITLLDGVASFNDIQVAFNLMCILKKEGLV